MDLQKYEQKLLNKLEDSYIMLLPVTAFCILLLSYLISLHSESSQLTYLYGIGLSVVIIITFFLKTIIGLKASFLIALICIYSYSILLLQDIFFPKVGLILLLVVQIVIISFFRDKVIIILSFLSILLMGYFSRPAIVTHADPKEYLFWVIALLTYILFVLLFYFINKIMKHHFINTIVELETSVHKTDNLAYYDQLTGLPNRNLLITTYDKLSKSHKTKGYIYVFHLQSLKSINILHGIEAGDIYIKEVTNIFSKAIGQRENEIFARINGNEFIWMLSDINSFEEFDARQLSVSRLFYEFLEDSEAEHMLKLYSGVVPFNGNNDTCNDLLQKADMVIEHAKINEITIPVIFNKSLKDKMDNNEKLKTIIHEAIKHDLFTLAYQEQVNNNTKVVFGVEALARLTHDQYGNISPGLFIPIIEKEKFAVKFGELIVNKVLNDHSKLFSHYLDLEEVSINISPTHALSPGFSEFVISEVTRRNLDPATIVLEITEDLLVEKLDILYAILKPLRTFGIKIALDDFGTGYASLNYLSNLDFDQLKIDKSFIDQIGSNPKTEGTIKAMLQIAREHKYTVIAEGVEQREQNDFLQSIGCNIIQGYLYSKPTPIHELLNL